MNIMITGGLGFIFSHVVEYFASKGNNVYVIDRLSEGSCRYLKGKWETVDNIYLCSIDINYIKSIHNPLPVKGVDFPKKMDVVIHAAAETNVDKSIRDVSPFIHSNISGTCAVLEYVKKCQPDLKKFLYVGTDEQYGSVESKVDSNALQNPANPYAASKSSASHFCWAYHNTYGIPMKEIRMCNIIGRRQAKTKLLPKVLFCLKNKEEIPVYDGGKFTREYMDVRDVCPLIEKVLEDDKDDIYNLTINQELSINEVIKCASKVVGEKPLLKAATREGHDKHYRMIPHPIVQKIDWETCVFEETVKWMSEES